MIFFEDITMLELMGRQNQGSKFQHVSTPRRRVNKRDIEI